MVDGARLNFLLQAGKDTQRPANLNPMRYECNNPALSATEFHISSQSEEIDRVETESDRLRRFVNAVFVVLVPSSAGNWPSRQA